MDNLNYLANTDVLSKVLIRTFTSWTFRDFCQKERGAAEVFYTPFVKIDKKRFSLLLISDNGFSKHCILRHKLEYTGRPIGMAIFL